MEGRSSVFNGPTQLHSSKETINILSMTDQTWKEETILVLLTLAEDKTDRR